MPLLELAGAPQDVIQVVRGRASTGDADCGVWEENWSTVMFFAGLGTQWNVVAGMAGVMYVGLNYPSVESTMRMQHIPRGDQKRLFEDVRRMEAAALEVRNAS